jgi:hypothetical protein
MTITMDPTPEQIALAGPGYEKDALAGFLQEIAEEDAAMAAGTLQAPAPQRQPDFTTLTIEGDEVEAEGDEEPPTEPGKTKPLAGKFKSAEELERAYLELQQKLGQSGQESPPEPAEVAPLTREEAITNYGESVVAAAEQEGIDLAQWDAAVQRGEDTSALRDKLAGALGIAPQMIERYEAAFRPAPAGEPEQAAGLSEEDAAAIRAEVGGDQQFAQLSQWAKANLSPAELADYNAAIDTGNAAAARAAVRWVAGRAATADREPQLVLANGGNASPALDVFESEDEAMEAKQALTKGGKQRYLVDEKYRRYIDAKFARSSIFM